MAFVEMGPACAMLAGPALTAEQALVWLVAPAEGIVEPMDLVYVMPDGLALPATAQDVLKTAPDTESAWDL